MPKKQKPFYSTTPAVPEKRIALHNPIRGPSLGSNTPTIVVVHPGRINSMGVESPNLRHPRPIHPHGFNHSIRSRQGNYRLSGAPKSHRVGKR